MFTLPSARWLLCSSPFLRVIEDGDATFSPQPPNLLDKSENGWLVVTPHNSGNSCANAVDAELGERIDLTIDSGCAACALLVGVASAVGMQELNRTVE